MEEKETEEKEKTNWVKIAVIALSCVLAVVLIAGVAFAVTRAGSGSCSRGGAAAAGGCNMGSGNADCKMDSGDCTRMQNGNCPMGGSAAGTGVETCPMGNSSGTCPMGSSNGACPMGNGSCH